MAGGVRTRLVLVVLVVAVAFVVVPAGMQLVINVTQSAEASNYRTAVTSVTPKYVNNAIAFYNVLLQPSGRYPACTVTVPAGSYTPLSTGQNVDARFHPAVLYAPLYCELS